MSCRCYTHRGLRKSCSISIRVRICAAESFSCTHAQLQHCCGSNLHKDHNQFLSEQQQTMVSNPEDELYTQYEFVHVQRVPRFWFGICFVRLLSRIIRRPLPNMTSLSNTRQRQPTRRKRTQLQPTRRRRTPPDTRAKVRRWTKSHSSCTRQNKMRANSLRRHALSKHQNITIDLQGPVLSFKLPGSFDY